MTNGLVPTGWYLSPELGVVLPPIEVAPPVARITDIEPAEPVVEVDMAPPIACDPPDAEVGNIAGTGAAEVVPPAPEAFAVPALVEDAADCPPAAPDAAPDAPPFELASLDGDSMDPDVQPSKHSVVPRTNR